MGDLVYDYVESVLEEYDALSASFDLVTEEVDLAISEFLFEVGVDPDSPFESIMSDLVGLSANIDDTLTTPSVGLTSVKLDRNKLTLIGII